VCLGAAFVVGAAHLGGCSKILGIEGFALTPDAPPDVPGPDAQLCWGSGLAPVCLNAPATGVRVLDTALDTDTLGTCTDLIAQPAGPELCVIAATQINVSNTVTATGTRPLMLLATDTIQIGGTLDVSSKRTAAKPGAGANFASCGAGTAPTNGTATTGAGGGGGGSFTTPTLGKGGNGGDSRDSAGVVVNNNGVSGSLLGLTFVRGGCRGQDGGDAGAAQGGVGGAGGGAVYLLAGTSITVDGNIYASGAGAAASAARAGGGGGGTGGLIGLEAPMIDVKGIVAANGANGSAGGTSVAGGVGADGPTMLYSTRPGGVAASAPTAGLTSAGLSTGGGGGGGGIGIVWVKGTLTGTMISPTPTLN
jgi:hypothetical protein